ncbi:hypothetical protein Tco_1035987 [Tanacetum coccineum]
MSVFAAMKCHTLGVGDLSLLSSRGIHIFIERAIVMTATAVINFMAKFVTGEALDAQDAEPSFHKRTHDDKDPSNDRGRRKGIKEERIPRRRLYIQNRPDAGWFTKKSGSANLLLKSGIDQNEDHILGPSTVAITKKLKELILKDELTIADLKGAGLEKLKKQYKNDVELEYHVDQLKAAVLTEA